METMSQWLKRVCAGVPSDEIRIDGFSQRGVVSARVVHLPTGRLLGEWPPRTETAQERPTSTETNVNEQLT